MTTAFENYMKPTNVDPFPKGSESEKPEPKVYHPNEFQNKALILVAHQFNETFFPGVQNMKTTADEFYVVWFAKTLGNWKALVSTDVISGQYWEVTYDGNKNQSYVDHYVKRSNEAITDEFYAALS